MNRKEDKPGKLEQDSGNIAGREQSDKPVREKDQKPSAHKQRGSAFNEQPDKGRMDRTKSRETGETI